MPDSLDIKSLPIFNDIINNKLMHSIMLISSDNEQLDNYANQICLTLFCQSSDKPCMVCDNCKKILHGNFVDILRYPQKDDVIKSNELIEIVDSVLEIPYESNAKVYILSNISEMDKLMQNKLLKSLEEPPQNVYFILKVNNENNILQTIKSRCRKIYIPKITKKQITTKLGCENNADAVDFCGGSIGLARQYLQDNAFSKNVSLVFDLLLNYKKSSQTLIYASKLYTKKDEFMMILNIYTTILQQSLYARLKLDNKFVFEKYNKDIQQINLNYSVDAIIAMIKNIIKLIEKFDRNCNYNALVDTFLLGILEEKHRWPM